MFRSRAFEICAALLIFIGVAVLLHARMGAYSAGFGAFEDEPAHLVTGLMIHDWLASGELLSPRAYAETYYVHYPKVAVGQWPPAYHGVLALWMAVTATQTTAIALLGTLLAAATALLVAVSLRRSFGPGPALAGGLVYLWTPIARSCSASVMTETLVALLGFASVLAFGAFLERDRGRSEPAGPGPGSSHGPDSMGGPRAGRAWALAFGVLAALTILTKGSGLALAALPPLAAWLAGQPRALLRPALWCGAGIVAVTAGPWYVGTAGVAQASWSGGSGPSLAYARYAATSYGGWLPSLAGLPAVGLVAVGLCAWLRRPGERGRGAAVAAWLPALALLHLLVPSSVEERHLAVLAPAWASLVVVGALAIAGGAARIAARGAERMPEGLGRDWAASAGAAAALVGAIALAPPTPPKAWSGFRDAGAALLEGPAARVMIASDPAGEGLFVAGAALDDGSRPSRIVLRASKVLGDAGWSGLDYEPRFTSDAAVQSWLLEHGVQALLIDRSVRGTRHWYAHMDQLERLVEGSEQWVAVDSFDLVRGGASFPGALAAYRIADPRGLGMPRLQLEDVRPEARAHGTDSDLQTTASRAE